MVGRRPMFDEHPGTDTAADAPVVPILRPMPDRLSLRIATAVAVLIVSLVLSTSGATAADPPADRLTVAMTDIDPFVSDNDGRADGFYAEIWDVVAQDLGVEYDILWVDSFPELLESIDQGEAELAIAPLAPTAEREVAFDFSSAVVSSGPQLAYHERASTSGSVLGAIISPSVRQILLAAVLGLMVLAHLIWLVERNRTDDEGGDFDSSYLRGIWDGFWWATVTVTTVGYGDKAPRSVGGRIIALMAMLLSLFLVGAFVSQVTDVLQERRDGAPATNLSDVSTPVGVVAGSSFADFVADEGVEIIGFDSQQDLFDAADGGEVDLVVANPFALATVGKDYGLIATGDVLYEEFETFGMAQDSPWREPVNQVLADLQVSGEIGAIIDRWVD